MLLTLYDIFTDKLHFKDTQNLCVVSTHCSHFCQIIYDDNKEQILFTTTGSMLNSPL